MPITDMETNVGAYLLRVAFRVYPLVSYYNEIKRPRHDNSNSSEFQCVDV